MILNNELKELLNNLILKRLDQLGDLYKHFHANPELSGQEEKTAARVAEEFNKLGLNCITGLGGHGLVGILDNGPGPCLLIRADMDALPITENTGLPYASEVKAVDHEGREVGVMHACGHDLHTTCLVGAASVLTELKDHFSGRILFTAQPAEEAIGGARLMLEDGLYAKAGRPDFAIGLHVKSELATGRVGIGEGIRSTGSHSLDVTIRGIGGHGASPHLAKDPIVLASQYVLALQTIVSREINPSEMGLITVGAIHGGTKRNIIPNEVALNLTIRSYNRDVGLKIVEAVERKAEGLARAEGLPEDLWPVVVEAEPSYPPVYNDPELNRRLEVLFTDLLGEDNVTELPPSNGSEDFGMFGLVDPPIPVLFYNLGVTSPERLAKAESGEISLAPEHEPGFYPDLVKSLPTGVLTMAGAALELLKK